MKKITTVIISLMLCEASMAYNLHIQKENYWEIDNPQIEKEKWLSFCKSDPTMEIQNSVTGINPETKEEIVVQTPGSCIWTSPNTNQEFVFYYTGDRITLGTNDIQIAKAKEIAASLGLKVYGDEGEEY
jgi:hypothetical protein